MMQNSHSADTSKRSLRNRIARILTGSFLIIMLIHIIAFTAIGLFTDMGWRLLWIFLAGLAIMLLVVMPLKYFRKKRRAAHASPADANEPTKTDKICL